MGGRERRMGVPIAHVVVGPRGGGWEGLCEGEFAYMCPAADKEWMS